MRIVSVIRRKAGTDVTFDGVEYRFRPEVEGDFNSLHVAEVDREDHVQRFLAIPEGYRLHPDAFLPEKPSREAELLANIQLLTEQVEDLAERGSNDYTTIAGLNSRVEDLMAENKGLTAQVAELTAQLDKATAPASSDKPAAKPKGK